MAQLVEAGMLPAAVAAELTEAIRARKTILIAGGTDTGKTTFAKAPGNEEQAESLEPKQTPAAA